VILCSGYATVPYRTVSSLYSNIYPTRCNFTQFIYIWKLLYMFRVLLPSITRSAYNCIYSFWYLSHRYLAVTVWQIPDAVGTVVCAPDDGWRYQPKHVEQFPDINKQCKVASCWIYIGIYLRCTDPWTLNVSFLFPEQKILPDKESSPYVLSDARVWSQTELFVLWMCLQRQYILIEAGCWRDICGTRMTGTEQLCQFLAERGTPLLLTITE